MENKKYLQTENYFINCKFHSSYKYLLKYIQQKSIYNIFCLNCLKELKINDKFVNIIDMYTQLDKFLDILNKN